MPKGSTITATEDSYIHTEEEEDALITAYQAKEIEATANAEGIVKVMAIVTPMQEQLDSLVDTVNKMPEVIRIEAKKAYQRGFKDGAIVGGALVGLLAALF